MDIELYNYYYESLKTLLDIDKKCKDNFISIRHNDNYKHIRKSNIKYLLKVLFSNTNCKYLDFEFLFKDPQQICSDFLIEQVHVLSRNAFDLFIKVPHFNNCLSGSKFYKKEHYLLNKSNTINSSTICAKVKDPEVIDELILNDEPNKKYLCTNPNLTMKNIYNILLNEDIGNQMGYLYLISRFNSFEYDGINYRYFYRDKDRPAFFKYLSDKLENIEDFKKCADFSNTYSDNGIFVQYMPLTEERIDYLLNFKYTNENSLLSNLSLNDKLAEHLVLRLTASVLLQKYGKQFIKNPNISLAFKNKVNDNYYKEIVFT